MLVPVVVGFGRSRPVGLLRFRALDVLYGVVLGGVLRLVQGWSELATGGSGALPSYPSVGGSAGAAWIVEALPAVTIGPVLEEFFFRGIVLVSLFAVLRRPFGRRFAAIIAVVASSGLFLLVHGLFGVVATDQVISIALLGAVCGTLVVLTGRIWGAVLVHLMFNLSFVALAAIGALLG
jgi:membrane protease YdiL (CAAX protease family)